MKFEIRKIVSETMKSSIPDDTQRENFGKEWENNLWVASKKLGIEFEEAQSIFSTWPLESILDGFFGFKICDDFSYLIFSLPKVPTTCPPFVSKLHDASHRQSSSEISLPWWRIPTTRDSQIDYIILLQLLVRTISPFKTSPLELVYKYNNKPPILIALKNLISTAYFSLLDILAETYILLEDFEKSDKICSILYRCKKIKPQNLHLKTIRMRRKIEEDIAPSEDYKNCNHLAV